ncbi:MAG: hypothetical protein ACRDYW_01335 [Acidimicrobiales bacterium]
MAGSSQGRVSARGVQACALTVGAVVQAAAFLRYMLPGMRGGTLDALLILSPVLLALVGPFALHWVLVRHRTLGAATAVGLAAAAVAVAADSITGSEEVEALLWFVVVIGEVMTVGVFAVGALIVSGSSALFGWRSSNQRL